MRLVLAGADNDSAIAKIRAVGHPALLCSYLNAVRGKKKLDGFLTQMHAVQAAGGHFIMDSGLFSMMFGAEKGKVQTEETLMAYALGYLDDMERIGFRDTIVEMDVHKVLGLTALARFRELFESRWPLERTIFVWHFEEGEQGWRDMVRRYPYVALSVPEIRRCARSPQHGAALISRFLAIARDIKPDIRIHLLGCTQASLLKQGGYDTCDSTSWLFASAYHKATVFRLDRVTQIAPKEATFQAVRAKLEPIIRPRLEAIGIFTEEQLDAYIIDDCVSLYAYTELNRHVNRLYYQNEPLPNLWPQS